MTREERDLRAQAETLRAEARTLVSENKMDEAKAKKKDMDAVLEKANMLAELEGEEAAGKQLSAGEEKDQKEQDKLYKNAFFKDFRNKKLTTEEREVFQTRNALHETGGSPEGTTGGMLVPVDAQTAINEYKRTLSPLEQFITTIPVGTFSGSRVYEKVATMTAMENLTTDDEDLPESDTPEFELLKYEIQDYGAWLPIPNSLLADSDQNIMAHLNQWIAKKSVKTRNTLILAILNAIGATAFGTDADKIKKALNITLDPMLAAGAIILTNQDGFHFLDTLKDGKGNPVMQPDITQPTQKLFAGKAVKVVGNTTLLTTGSSTKLAPIFVGNLQEAVAMFERQGHMVGSTNIGGTAWRKNRTELRAIEREDLQPVDTGAVVHGTLDVTAVVA